VTFLDHWFIAMTAVIGMREIVYLFNRYMYIKGMAFVGAEMLEARQKEQL